MHYACLIGCQIAATVQEMLNPDGSINGEKSYLQSAMQTARASASVIVLHGWVAVLSMLSTVFVVAVAAYWVFRRASGLDKPHTTIVPRAGTSEGIE